MPYISKDRRMALTNFEPPQCAGELNYLFTKLSHEYIRNHGESYQNYNDIIGALEGAKFELYRRKIITYENTKILENGDV